MSSLWTPGGEVPVDRDRDRETPPGEPPSGAGSTPPGDEERAAQMAEMRRQLLDAPAAQVIVQHVMALYELAAMHLAEERPRLADAKLAIDAVEAVVHGLEGRLGDAEAAITAALPELKMAFVETSDRVQSGASEPPPA